MLRTTGLDALVDGAISSAEAGARKPAPASSAARSRSPAPRRGGRRALHAGDSLELDVAGALGAGLRGGARRARGRAGAACRPASRCCRARRARGARRVTCCDDVRSAAPDLRRSAGAPEPPAAGAGAGRRTVAPAPSGAAGRARRVAAVAGGARVRHRLRRRRSCSASSSSSWRRRPASTEDAPGINIGLTIMQNVALVGAAFFFAAMSPAASRAADFGLRAGAVLAQRRAAARRLGRASSSSARPGRSRWSSTSSRTCPRSSAPTGPLLNVLAVVVLVTVIAPLGEELFFRGFFFGALRNWRGPVAGRDPHGHRLRRRSTSARRRSATSCRSMIFGVGLCMLYEWTGSLYPAIALHALNNSIALGANLDWDWQIPAMMVGSTSARAAARVAARARRSATRRPPAGDRAPRAGPRADRRPPPARAWHSAAGCAERSSCSSLLAAGCVPAVAARPRRRAAPAPAAVAAPVATQMALTGRARRRRRARRC